MNMKKILLFVGLPLILAGAGGYFVLNKNKQDEHSTEPASGEDEGGHGTPSETTKKPVVSAKDDDYADFASEEEETGIVAVNQTHIINLPGPGRPGFLKCQLSIFIRDEELGKQMSSDTPTLQRETAKAMVLDILSELTSEEVLEPETKHTLRQDIIDRLNEKFKPGPPVDKKAPPRPRKPIKDVMIVEWAVQR